MRGDRCFGQRFVPFAQADMDRSMVHADAVFSRIRFGLDGYPVHEAANFRTLGAVPIEICKTDLALMQGDSQSIAGAELGFHSVFGIGDMQGHHDAFGHSHFDHGTLGHRLATAFGMKLPPCGDHPVREIAAGVKLARHAAQINPWHHICGVIR